ncbi:MAG: hypothetical protein RIT07_1854 [Bacteroidota bacterium]
MVFFNGVITILAALQFRHIRFLNHRNVVGIVCTTPPGSVFSPFGLEVFDPVGVMTIHGGYRVLLAEPPVFLKNAGRHYPEGSNDYSRNGAWNARPRRWSHIGRNNIDISPLRG